MFGMEFNAFALLAVLPHQTEGAVTSEEVGPPIFPCFSFFSFFFKINNTITAVQQPVAFTNTKFLCLCAWD